MSERVATKSHFTYGDYVQWSADERWELIEGKAFDMSPATSRRHQDVVGGLFQTSPSIFRNRALTPMVSHFREKLDN